MATPLTDAHCQPQRRLKIVSQVMEKRAERACGTMLVLLAIFSGMAATLADEVHEGKVLSAGDDKLTILDSDGENETFAVTAETKITLDGKPVQLNDLQSGFPVKVKAVRKGDKYSATSIEARTSK